MNILDINDCAISLITGGEVRSVPGALWFKDRKTIISGDAALAQLRVHPLDTSTQHWMDLSDASFKKPKNGLRHHADYVWHQLKAMNVSGIDAVLVPSHYEAPQLSLLLGVLQSLQLNPKWLLPRALITASIEASDRHLDVQFRQGVVTQFTLSSEVEISSYKIESMLGLLPLWDRVMHLVQTRCIQDTRFDPLHSAKSEQALFNQMHGFLKTLATSSMAILDLGSDKRSLNFTSADLSAACDHYIGVLSSHLDGASKLAVDCLISEQLSLESLPCPVSSVSHTQISRALSDIRTVLPSDESGHWLARIPLIKQSGQADLITSPLPDSPPENNTNEPNTGVKNNRATHLLLASRAYASQRMWLVPTNDGALSILDTPPEADTTPIPATVDATPQGLQLSAQSHVLLNGAQVHTATTIYAGDVLSAATGKNTITGICVV